jgi:hypothetical protein
MMAKIGRMSVPASADAEWNEWYNGEAKRSEDCVVNLNRSRVVEKS